MDGFGTEYRLEIEIEIPRALWWRGEIDVIYSSIDLGDESHIPPTTIRLPQDDVRSDLFTPNIKIVSVYVVRQTVARA